MPFLRNREQEIARLFPPESFTDEDGKAAVLYGIKSGDWIDIRTYSNAGMRQRIAAQGITITYDPVRKERRVVSDAFAVKLATLTEIVIAWSDDSEVNDDNLALLDPIVHDWIYAQYVKLSATRSDEEKNALRGSYSAGQPVVTSPTN